MCIRDSSISGPDIRWCGNEAGDTRPSEWSVLPTGFYSPEEVAARSQQSDTKEFREKKIGEMEKDLGSREFLEGAKGYKWSPEMCIRDSVITVSLEAATTGRLSVTYYSQLKAEDFIERINLWYKDCLLYTSCRRCISRPCK